MKHYGDITTINGREIESVDVITFGSPCQDLSLAGKRAGLDGGTRSSLFFEAIRIIKEMRDETDGMYPRFAVWENVTGAFSSNNGQDFHEVLRAFHAVTDSTDSIPEPDKNKTGRLVWAKAGLIVGDNSSIAWRTTDAQYWGVPQRRRRIYLVADFRGHCAGTILFEPQSQGRRPETSQRSEQDTAGDTQESAGELTLNFGRQGDRINPIVSNTLGSLGGGCGGKSGLYCLPSTPICGVTSGAQFTGKFNEIASTIKATDYKGPQAVCYSMQRMGEYIENNVASTQLERQHKDATDLVTKKNVVRRLTPTECARIQGFPDRWGELAPFNPDHSSFWQEVRNTDRRIRGLKPTSANIENWYNKLRSDSAVYKAYGNGLALPNAFFVLHGIACMGAETLGSLFDGIGGFPLAGLLNDITPIWASEIEPYPIAVTVSRFGLTI